MEDSVLGSQAAFFSTVVGLDKLFPLEVSPPSSITTFGPVAPSLWILDLCFSVLAGSIMSFAR